MKILLCSNGTGWANRALKLGKQIALAAGSEVEVLLASRYAERLDAVRQTVKETVDDLQEGGIPVTVHRRVGRLAEEVIGQAHSAPYDLVVIGSRGRRGIKRLFLGSVAMRVIEHIPTSVLVVKGRRRDLTRFLVCSAAGPASERAIHFAGQLARALSASVTLIHVMSQIPVTGEADLVDLQAAAGELIERHSREGVHLNQMMDLLAARDIKTRAVVRHGLVVEEIMAEAREGQFDLLAIGAHAPLGVSSLLAGDLAEQILLAADLPVLVVRQVHPES